MTNRSLSKRIIAAATAQGKLHELCYYVDMWMPRELRPRPDVDHVPASWPPGFVPYIPLAPDETIASDYAHILVALMESGNQGRGMIFRSELIGIDQLEETQYIPYAWGEDLSSRLVDKVCPICGAVEQVFIGESGKCCQPTRKRRSPPKPAYPLPHNAQRIGLHWWGGAKPAPMSTGLPSAFSHRQQRRSRHRQQTPHRPPAPPLTKRAVFHPQEDGPLLSQNLYNQPIYLYSLLTVVYFSGTISIGLSTRPTPWATIPTGEKNSEQPTPFSSRTRQPVPRHLGCNGVSGTRRRNCHLQRFIQARSRYRRQSAEYQSRLDRRTGSSLVER